MTAETIARAYFYAKLAGVSATLLALGFFYGAGKLHEHAEKRIKKRD